MHKLALAGWLGEHFSSEENVGFLELAGKEEVGHLNDKLQEGLEVNWTFASERGFLGPGAIPNNLGEWLSILL